MTSSRLLKDFMRTTYFEGATGPNKYDCGAFVRDVAKEVFKVKVPDLRLIEERCGKVKEDTKRIQEILQQANFQRVEDPRPGDIVAISRWNNGFVDHIGIMVNETQFVQMNRRGPEISGISSPAYQRRIKGYYRCR